MNKKHILLFSALLHSVETILERSNQKDRIANDVFAQSPALNQSDLAETLSDYETLITNDSSVSSTSLAYIMAKASAIAKGTGNKLIKGKDKSNHHQPFH